MGTKWHTNLPAEWEDAPRDPPTVNSDSVIEPYGDGVVMRPLEACVDHQRSATYVYCDGTCVRTLGEETV